jgi:hypothetical protein
MPSALLCSAVVGVGVLSNLFSLLLKEPSSVLKGGVKVCQQQLVNELLGPLVTEFVRNFSREDATPYQRGSNGGLLSRIQAAKFIRHNTSRIFRAAHIESWVAYCAQQVQRFDLDQKFWCLGFNEQIFGADEQNPGRGQSD